LRNFCIATAIAHVVLAIIVQISNPNYRHNICPITDSLTSYELIAIFLFIVYGIVLLILAFLIRKVNDVFFIAKEIQIVAIIEILIPLSVFILNSAYSNKKISVYLEYMGAIIIFTISIILPIYKSYFKPVIIMNASQLPSLGAILKDAIGLKYLQYFLKREFAIEKLLFLQDVENFKNEKITANKIVEKYIKVDSPLEININSNVRKNILQNYENNKAVFDKVEKIIFRDLSEDSYLRFIRSKEFALLIEERKNMQQLDIL